MSRYDFTYDPEAKPRFQLRWGAFAGFAVNAPLLLVYGLIRQAIGLRPPTLPPVPILSTAEAARQLGPRFWWMWIVVFLVAVVLPSAVLLSGYRSRLAGVGYLLVGSAILVLGLAVDFAIASNAFAPVPD